MRAVHFAVAILLLLIIAAVAYYELRPVEVQSGTMRVCSDERHEGERVVGKQISTDTVPHWTAKRYSVVKDTIVCGTCRERLERERREAAERAERERREAERQARFDTVIGVWEEHITFGGSQWAFNRNGTGHNVNITGSFNFNWEIEGDRLHVTRRRENLSIPFEATARTLTLHLPDGTITYTRVD